MNSRKFSRNTHSRPLRADKGAAYFGTPRHSGRSPDIIGAKRRSKIPGGNLLKLSRCLPNRPSCHYPIRSAISAAPAAVGQSRKTKPISQSPIPTQPVIAKGFTPISRPGPREKTKPIPARSCGDSRLYTRLRSHERAPPALAHPALIPGT